jgi:methenyltetrahydromethanopterin cyclohydrolase
VSRPTVAGSVQGGDVLGRDLVVVGEAVDAVVTEEMLGAIDQFERHPLCWSVVENPEIREAAADSHGLATAVALLGSHTGERVATGKWVFPGSGERTTGDHVFLNAPPGACGMESLNRMATELVDEAIDFADELAIEVHTLSGDAAVLDFGVDLPGGIEAGLLLAEIQTAGLATLDTRLDEVAGAPLTHVECSTDQPALSLLCAGKAGWEVSTGAFDALGSGPARALVAEEPVFGRINYRDEFDLAVLALESDRLPDERVAAQVAERAGVPESGVFLPTYATASVTGSVVAASRAAELGVYRLTELGYDPLDVLSVTGSAPIAPVAGDEQSALATTQDAIAYGSQVHLVVDSPFDRFDELVSTAREEYGTPFADIYAGVDWAYDQLPLELFGPAQVTVDVVGGDTHVVGDRSEDLLAESFDL